VYLALWLQWESERESEEKRKREIHTGYAP